MASCSIAGTTRIWRQNVWCAPSSPSPLSSSVCRHGVKLATKALRSSRHTVSLGPVPSCSCLPRTTGLRYGGFAADCASTCASPVATWSRMRDSWMAMRHSRAIMGNICATARDSGPARSAAATRRRTRSAGARRGPLVSSAAQPLARMANATGSPLLRYGGGCSSSQDLLLRDCSWSGDRLQNACTAVVVKRPEGLMTRRGEAATGLVWAFPAHQGAPMHRRAVLCRCRRAGGKVGRGGLTVGVGVWVDIPGGMRKRREGDAREKRMRRWLKIGDGIGERSAGLGKSRRVVMDAISSSHGGREREKEKGVGGGGGGGDMVSRRVRGGAGWQGKDVGEYGFAPAVNTVAVAASPKLGEHRMVDEEVGKVERSKEDGYGRRSRGQKTTGEAGMLHGAPTRGNAMPFGPSARNGGVNFSLFSSGAREVSLCLFTADDLQEGRVTEEIVLHPLWNRTGQIWHVFVPDLAPNLTYGYRVDGSFLPEQSERYDKSKVLVDPYAKLVTSSRRAFGQPTFLLADEENGDKAGTAVCWPQLAGLVPMTRGEGEVGVGEDDVEDDFDWEGDTSPSLHMKDLVIYEMHVRGFTRHASSKTKAPRGTYLSLIEKLPHLKELGVNAIELLPVHEFNELEFYSYNPAMDDHRVNFWGYSTINFFSPMSRYAAAHGGRRLRPSGGGGGGGDGGGKGEGAVRSGGVPSASKNAIWEFKTLVKECHKMGMEVILDVVFNHTAEGNERGPIVSFRGLDNRVFYMTAPRGEFYNYSGCGNTFNCNHPVVRQFIIDCLRYWVLEMHVDGFRFDLASVLTRSSSMWSSCVVYGQDGRAMGGVDGGGGGEEDGIVTGTPLPRPPLIDMICNDGVLRGTKLIAEAWDASGLYQVGNFPYHQGLWAEWNGKFRDSVRMFIKGSDGEAGAFASYLCGSPQLYAAGGRKPYHSINFVTSHDGFTLADLVSYNEKQNFGNGENNNDGDSNNLSWNCGADGEVVDGRVATLRQRQMRNFVLALMVARGVPMIHMGDEYAHTKGGNNNTYCQDNNLNYFRWDKKDADVNGLCRFFRLAIRLRREWECLRSEEFPTDENLSWHGHQAYCPDWSETSRFVAFTVKDEVKGEMYVAFNASHLPVIVNLPARNGYVWDPVIDTSKLPPYDFLEDDSPQKDGAMANLYGFLSASAYPIMGYSSVLLKLVPKTGK